MTCKLSQRDAGFILVFREFGFSKPALAKEYGVHIDTLRNVLNGKSHQKGRPSSKLRKLSDDQVRQMRRWSDEEHLGEAAISKRLGGLVGRSTARQVINRESYKDVV